ncbi:hypothetical protein DPEC_G00224880 [Dallia pectoralis]|uniref:Uncharacterized protein n=1 Tax=Dallia pectoralis TaxID=75939 RepID=A0ACC2G0C8_DALPE|nr:hypothetical protein DPEC_G00224880 [Dallia pectoralis]
MQPRGKQEYCQQISTTESTPPACPDAQHPPTPALSFRSPPRPPQRALVRPAFLYYVPCFVQSQSDQIANNPRPKHSRPRQAAIRTSGENPGLDRTEPGGSLSAPLTNWQAMICST